MANSILMLEHDDDDRHITKSVFAENGYPVKIDFVSNSDDLFAFLLSCEKTSFPFPRLILLNYYSLPLNAVEILRVLKQNPLYAHIPVVVLSGTMQPGILHECYTAGASSCIKKPALTGETDRKISAFMRYWFEAVDLP
ncbi:MAG TPA: hypothetical protein VF490_09140 [Chryseosolibacter sp.]